MFYFFFFNFCSSLIEEKKFLYTNSVDPDQMPHSAVSDLGVHRLPMPYASTPTAKLSIIQ